MNQVCVVPIAVSLVEMKQWGCPYCGHRSGYSPISGGQTAIFTCGECGGSCAVLGDGVTKSTIGFDGFYPQLQPHPRRGTPSRTPDKQPEGGGEFFWSRGIGLDSTPGCFVCAGEKDMHNNIAAFVQCRESGVRVVAMFYKGARLDYRDYEPDRVQVKIGACDEHVANLRELDRLCEDGVITKEKVIAARNLGTKYPKITKRSITKCSSFPFNIQSGYDLKIYFDTATLPEGDWEHRDDYSAYVRAVGDLLTQDDVSPDKAHFFDNYVTMFFPEQKDAQAALNRVKKACE